MLLSLAAESLLGARGSLRPVLTSFEVGAASAVYPKAATVNAPGVVANARRATDLPDESNVASGTDIAPFSSAIVGRAGYDDTRSICGRGRGRRSAAADDKFRTTSAVDPKTTTVDAPGTVANARGAADLADQADITRGADVAPISATVVGGASDAWRPTVARLSG